MPKQSSSDLYVTGIVKADRLLQRDGTALLIGMLLDQQVPMEWAFTGPHTLTERFGHLDPRKFAEMDVERFVTRCCEKPAIHRFPASMARRIHELCGIIADQYANKGANIWKDVDDASELYARLRKLPGFGDNGFAVGKPLIHQDDIMLRGVGNLAFGEKADLLLVSARTAASTAGGGSETMPVRAIWRSSKGKDLGEDG